MIVSYDFPPFTGNWGGSQRVFYLANKLNKSNHEVEIFCLKKYSIYPIDVEVGIVLNQIEIKSNIIKHLLKAKSSGKNSPIDKSVFDKLRKYFKGSKFLINILKWIDSNFFNEPGFLTGIIGFVWSKELEKNPKFLLKIVNANIIIISGPPFSLFSLVKSIRRDSKKCKIILDYRDPWNLWHDGNEYTKKKEKALLESVDHIVTATETVKLDTVRLFKISEEKVSTITNGVNPLFINQNKFVLKSLKKRGDIFEVCYSGAITINENQKSSYRDFTLIYDYLEQNVDKIKFKVVGVTNMDSLEVKNLKDKFSESISFIPELNPVEAFKHLASSDILLLLHIAKDNSSKYIISGKYYDYLCARKPILSIGAKPSLHFDLINTHQNGVHVAVDKDSLRDGIEKLIDDYPIFIDACFNIDPSIFDRDLINEKYLELIKAVSCD